MRNIKGKRALAFIIDSLVLSIIIGLVSKINFLNPTRSEYLDAVDRHQEHLQNSIDNNDYRINDDIEKTMYDVAYYGKSYTIIEFGVIILYFTLFPYFFNGQTIGKKVTKLQIVHAKNKEKVSIISYFIRSLIYPIFALGFIYCSLTVMLNLFVLLIFKQPGFILGNKILIVAGLIWGYVDAIYGLNSKDGRALHDLICGTKVIPEDNV